MTDPRSLERIVRTAAATVRGLSGVGLDASIERISTLDGACVVRLSLPPDRSSAPRTELAHIAGQLDRAVLALAAEADRPIARLTVEFVDHAGDVLASFGERSPTASTAPTTATSPAAGPSRAPSAAAPASPSASAGPMPGIRHAIAVGAGKGGVGKSTIAVNLAVGLALRGHSVGLLDADIYGPSLPTLLGLHAMDAQVVGDRLQPFRVHGIKAATLGKLVEPEKPLIWRGPMAHQAFRQLLERTDWGELDYLVIDLPPGTGDIALTMAQSLRLSGAVVVCTPQRVAQDDASRALRMFEQLGIDVLGVVENMSVFIADDTDPPREYDIFGRGGAEHMAQRMGVPFLGALPLTMGLRRASDDGTPLANWEKAGSGDRLRIALDRLVSALESQVALLSLAQSRARPTLTIS